MLSERRSSAKVDMGKQDPSKCNIPETIEERRKDADGRVVVVHRYARGKMLGKGGFAKCFFGTLMSSNENFALKIVDKSTLVKERAKQKLQTEIAIHKNIRHSHVVKFERFFDDHSFAYMLLELCSNNSMSELMKRRKTLTEPEIRYYLQQLISALKHLHGHGIIHRDLKLGNLFIDSDMKIKVGDFGLATRLTHEGERKRTVCGTPNYIAPEILEGKEGHSFEVDIWSTGVLIFTLLCGKPPFESKDIKATYKRILTNNYSFPEASGLMISESSKHLIRSILQTKPERRPSLSGITDHAFFQPPAYTPLFLPATTLKHPPSMPTESKFVSHNNAPSHRVNDENDANYRNVMPATYANGNAQKILWKGEPATTSGSHQPTRRPSSHHQSAESASRKAPPPLQQLDCYAGAGSTETAPVSSRSQGPASSSSKTSHRSAPKAKPFEIFDEVKPSTVEDASSKAQQIAKPQVLPANKQQVAKDSKLLYLDLENVHLDDDHARLSTQSQAQHSATNAAFSARAPFEAWTTAPSATGVTNKPTASDVGTKQKHSSSSSASHTKSNKVAKVPKEDESLCAEDVDFPTATDNRDECVMYDHVTPPKDITNSKAKKELNTLEAMHETLNQSFVANRAPATQSVQAALTKPSSNPAEHANIWVVRYVDYTSKYGLGFLLNTGSAGVYFNDSTKIVLSPDGLLFQYFERRSKKIGCNSSEHTCQSYPITAFPPELQKKVTLLKHFRSYLNDQQRAHGQGGGTETSETGFPVSVATGATNSFQPSSSSGASTSQPANFGMESNGQIIFLKKWIRTRHAILFRLSNKTVQVVFFDKSEVLLAAEARYVTYVSKDGHRAEHSLSEVMQTGRTDIARRLKYTKDVMYRLITMQTTK